MSDLASAPAALPGRSEQTARKGDIVAEEAAVSVADPQGIKIAAFVSCPADRRLTIIDLKSFSSKQLPPYMIPDTFTVLATLPRTSTGKVDLQALQARA